MNQNHNTDTTHPPPAHTTQQGIDRKRRQLENCFRIGLGIEQLFVAPWKNVFLVLFLAAFGLAWFKRGFVPGFPSFFEPIGKYIVSAVIISVSSVFLLGILILLGTPWKARADLESIRMAFTAADLTNARLFLMRSKRSKNGVLRREWYCKGISKSRFEARQEEISDVLDCHWLQPIQYGGKNGNNRKRIVMYTASGYKPAERGALHDDEL